MLQLGMVYGTMKCMVLGVEVAIASRYLRRHQGKMDSHVSRSSHTEVDLPMYIIYRATSGGGAEGGETERMERMETTYRR